MTSNERPEDHHGDEVERQERADRARDKAPATADVIPIAGGGFRVGERERRPILSPERRIAELRAEAPALPRLVVAGDVVDELERQHRRAYRRRQEARARARRRRAAVIYARDLALLAIGAGLTGLSLIVILSAGAELLR